MRIKTLFIAVVMILSAPALSATSKGPRLFIKPPKHSGMIKVLLQKNVDGANLEVRGGYKIYDAKDGSKIANGILNKQFLLRPTLDGLSWGEAYPGVYQIAIVPNSESTYVLVDGIQYAGNIYAFQVGSTISIINEVPIESFTKAMLNPKINAELHPEVLAALSIIARTQAYYYATKNEQAFWHLDAKAIDYQGVGVCMRANGVDDAVNLTHHLVMKSDSYGMKEGFFDATYSLNCAGKTAPYHLIYRKEGYNAPRGVESPLALANRSHSHWTTSLHSRDLAQMIGVEEIDRYEVCKDSVSGKVFGMRFFTKDETLDYDFIRLQSIIGQNVLKSNDLSVKYADNIFTFNGFGEGLSTGMCLYSAEEMARRGQNAAQILEFFFPHSRVAFMKIEE